MDITNLIAQSGNNNYGNLFNQNYALGRNLAAQKRAEDRSVEQEQYNRLRTAVLDKKQAEAEQDAKEIELSRGLLTSLTSSVGLEGEQGAAQREQLYQGFKQGYVNIGGSLDDIPETYNPAFIYELGGRVGFDFNRGQRTPSEIQALRAKFELGGLSPEEERRAARINLGIDPRAVGSAAQTIANTQGQTEIIANSESAIKGQVAGAQEEAKLTIQQRLKPLIAEAEQSAKSRGEKLSDLNQAKAALPGLNEVVEDLRQLAPIATSTRLGGAFDVLAKEAGFGATEGATAKAKYIAIVSNQVLPLLKQTFGGAFTVAEGDELKKTLGDPNGSPEEKIAQLEAFIDQKYREVETKERELGINRQPEAQGGNENAAALNWARNNPDDPRAQQILQLLGN